MSVLVQIRHHNKYQIKNYIAYLVEMWNKIKNLFSSNAQQQNSTNFDQQQTDEQSQNNYQNYNNFNQNEVHSTGSVNLLKAVDKEKKVVAVIVTFCSGSSYDHLFTQVEQKAEQGTQVLVYSCNSASVKEIHKAFTTDSKNQVIKQMVNYIKQVDPDCVVFNWQCSSGYSSEAFGQGKSNVIDFVKMLIDRGHMVMFSDFSLKALIKQWDNKILGPNPFVKVSQYGGNFTLEFNSKDLIQCPSAQLQIIGEMAAQGHCNVQAMGGTIVYGVNKKNSDNEFYKLKVLTVATSLQSNQKYLCEINGKKGNAGHVLLTYKSGGHLLTSMGHWIELMKVDTSQKVLFDIAAREFGQQKMKQMQMQYANLSSETEKKAYISKNAVEFVQSSAPCANMSKKARSKY